LLQHSVFVIAHFFVETKDKAEGVQKMFDLGFEAMESGKLEGAIYLLSQFINSVDGLVTLPDRWVLCFGAFFIYLPGSGFVFLQRSVSGNRLVALVSHVALGHSRRNPTPEIRAQVTERGKKQHRRNHGVRGR
jgi:hypothetical protein